MLDARSVRLSCLSLLAAGIAACKLGPTEPTLSPGRITGCSIELKGITLRGTVTNETSRCNAQGITSTSSTDPFGTEVEFTQVYGTLDSVTGTSAVACSGDRLICARSYPHSHSLFNLLDSATLIIDTARREIRVQGIRRASDFREPDPNKPWEGHTTRSDFGISFDHIPFGRSFAATQTVEIDGDELRRCIGGGYFSGLDLTTHSFINDVTTRTMSSAADTIGALAPDAYLKITFTYR